MKKHALFLGAMAALSLSVGVLARGPGSAFTYQGEIKSGGAPVAAPDADVRVTPWDSAIGGAPLAGADTHLAVPLTNGVFTVDLDFGPNIFNGQDVYLAIEVSVPAGGAFVPLAPRQKVMPTPYAMYAQSIGTTYADPVDFTNPLNTFAGNGADITKLNASNVTSGNLPPTHMPTGGSWSLASNLNVDAGTLFVNPTSNRVGIGTAAPTDSRLHIDGTGASFGLTLTGNTNNNRGIIIDDGVVSWAIRNFDGDFVLSVSDPVTETPFRIDQLAPSSALTIDASGNVGVKTLTPGATLAVESGTHNGPVGGGFLHVGPDSGTHVSLDTNEIQTYSGSTPTGNLYLQFYGGDLRLADGGGDVWLPDALSSLGIGTTTPDNKLDVSGKISLTQSLGDEMVIINDDIWLHGFGNQDFGDGGDHFIMASREGSAESSGIFGDGDAVAIWSPGDAVTGQPAAHIYVLDEDLYGAGVITDPYDGGALQAYMNTAGVWIASDINRKQNIEPLTGATSKLMQINGYTYEYKLAPTEVEKGQQPMPAAGLIAQEVVEVLPEAVNINDAGEHFINLTSVTPLIIEALKEQIVSGQGKDARIEMLLLQNAELEARITALERLINDR